jgi:hypothetical protein
MKRRRTSVGGVGQERQESESGLVDLRYQHRTSSMIERERLPREENGFGKIAKVKAVPAPDDPALPRPIPASPLLL